MTFLVYAALGAVPFFLVLQLQTVLGTAPCGRAGTLPITICMLFLAGKGGGSAPDRAADPDDGRARW